MDMDRAAHLCGAWKGCCAGKAGVQYRDGDRVIGFKLVVMVGEH